MLVVDSQVHCPDTSHAGPIPGLPAPELVAAMDEAGVARCVAVPMLPPGEDAAANNAQALAAAASHPGRLAVMAPLDLRQPKPEVVRTWRSQPRMLGIRLAFLREPNLSLLTGEELEWLWSSAESADVPITLLAPGLESHLDKVAATHPRLRVSLDHFNLDPRVTYPDLSDPVARLLELARRPNVAVKASALACWASDSYPYPSLRDPIARVLEAFGAERVFWGSDLTRLPCSYAEYLRMFTDGLPFLTGTDLELVMGGAAAGWFGWL